MLDLPMVHCVGLAGSELAVDWLGTWGWVQEAHVGIKGGTHLGYKTEEYQEYWRVVSFSHEEGCHA